MSDFRELGKPQQLLSKTWPNVGLLTFCPIVDVRDLLKRLSCLIKPQERRY